MKSGAAQISAERTRQIKEECWSEYHDDSHKGKQLARAAESYLSLHTSPDKWAKERGLSASPNHDWPWALKWWKPTNDPVRNLVKAGALIAAEIDRLQRKSQKRKAQ